MSAVGDLDSAVRSLMFHNGVAAFQVVFLACFPIISTGMRFWWYFLEFFNVLFAAVKS